MSAIWICGGDEQVSHLDGFSKNERWATLVSHLLVCLMMVCLTISFAQFLGRFLPLSESLPLWGGVMAMEAFLSYRVTRAKPFRMTVTVQVVYAVAVNVLFRDLTFPD